LTFYGRWDSERMFGIEMETCKSKKAVDLCEVAQEMK
jgi:hypothetical protein